LWFQARGRTRGLPEDGGGVETMNGRDVTAARCRLRTRVQSFLSLTRLPVISPKAFLSSVMLSTLYAQNVCVQNMSVDKSTLDKTTVDEITA
jgi:hypothetical protein